MHSSNVRSVYSIYLSTIYCDTLIGNATFFNIIELESLLTLYITRTTYL